MKDMVKDNGNFYAMGGEGFFLKCLLQKHPLFEDLCREKTTKDYNPACASSNSFVLIFLIEYSIFTPRLLLGTSMLSCSPGDTFSKTTFCLFTVFFSGLRNKTSTSTCSSWRRLLLDSFSDRFEMPPNTPVL